MILTGVFRASYAYVFKPQASQNGGEPKYQITMLIPKSDTATVQAIRAGIDQALRDGVHRAFNGQMPANPETPLYDGDGVKKNGDPFGEECRGCWVVRASSKNRPSVVDLNVQPIIDPNAFYSGCYARATVSFFAYNKNGSRGVTCTLNNIQKIADGEPFSGKTTAEEDFGGANAWNGQPSYGMPYSGAQASNPSVGPISGTHEGYASTPGGGYPSASPVGYGQPAAGHPQGMPGYGQPVAGYPQGMPGYGQPVAGYPQGMPSYGQSAPPYSGTSPAAGMADPITGLPVSGGVMGI